MNKQLPTQYRVIGLQTFRDTPDILEAYRLISFLKEDAPSSARREMIKLLYLDEVESVLEDFIPSEWLDTTVSCLSELEEEELITLLPAGHVNRAVVEEQPYDSTLRRMIEYIEQESCSYGAMRFIFTWPINNDMQYKTAAAIRVLLEDKSSLTADQFEYLVELTRAIENYQRARAHYIGSKILNCLDPTSISAAVTTPTKQEGGLYLTAEEAKKQ